MTHRPDAIPPERFRAQATGVTTTLQGSERTGLDRARRAVAAAPAAKKHFMNKARGYPGE
jgi:hypothetical protein